MQSWLASVFYGAADRAGGGPPACCCSWRLSPPSSPALVWTLTRPAHVAVQPAADRRGRSCSSGRTAAGSSARCCSGCSPCASSCSPPRAASIPAGCCPTMWLWVNTHGSFPLGLVAVALIAHRAPPRPPVGRDRDPGAEVGGARHAARWASTRSARGCSCSRSSCCAGRTSCPTSSSGRRRSSCTSGSGPSSSCCCSPSSASCGGRLARRPAGRRVHRRVAARRPQRRRRQHRASCPGSLAGSPASARSTGDERRSIYRPMAAALASSACSPSWSAASGPVYSFNGYPVAAVTWAEREGLLGPGSAPGLAGLRRQLPRGPVRDRRSRSSSTTATTCSRRPSSTTS